MVHRNLGQRPCIVMAHPDDETLWAGGLPIRFPTLEWSAVCCSIPRLDPERADHFKNACGVLGIRNFNVLPFSEGEPSREFEHIDMLHRLFSTSQIGTPCDSFVTHGPDGEYGHVHHKQIHRYVMEHAGDRPVLTININGGGELLRLDNAEEDQKLKALQCYQTVLPGAPPKWRALLDRYYDDGRRLFSCEYYDLRLPNA